MDFKVGQRYMWDNVDSKCPRGHVDIKTIFEVVNDDRLKAIQLIKGDYPYLGDLWRKSLFCEANCTCVSYLQGQDKPAPDKPAPDKPA
jgi:hypothetical protein